MSLRSTAWAFTISALAVIGFNANAAYADYSNWPRYDAHDRANFIPNGAMFDAFTKTTGLCLMLAVGAIGAMTIVGEYSTGLIRTTFAAVPARRSVMAAKMIVVTAVTAVTAAFGAVVSAASFGVTQAILSGRHAGLSIGFPGALRVVVASTLLAPVSALVGLGLGAVIRHSATTMVATFVILLLLPTALSANHHWTAVVDHAMPFNAWARLAQANAWPADYPSTITGAWIVYAVWSLAAAILAVTTVHHRDQ